MESKIQEEISKLIGSLQVQILINNLQIKELLAQIEELKNKVAKHEANT